MPELVDMHRGTLPHIQEEGQIFSLTWRLAFTLPKVIQDILHEMHELDMLKHDNSIPAEANQRRYAILANQYDDYLGKLKTPELDLSQVPVAEIICQAFKFYHLKLYLLHAYCLMPNHLHLLIQPLPDNNHEFPKNSDIVRKIKSWTAHQINVILNREGTIWQHEYFDRYIRNQSDYARTVQYILDNPVKAQLTGQQNAWPWSYFDSSLQPS